MPEKIEETVSEVRLLFPDEASGTEFRLSEDAVYDAGEVREETESDVPKYGKWLPVKIDGKETYMTAPRELREELMSESAEPGQSFEITRMEKSGQDDSAPYEVNLEPVSDSGQGRLS